jgi:hypothetical protein
MASRRFFPSCFLSASFVGQHAHVRIVGVGTISENVNVISLKAILYSCWAER